MDGINLLDDEVTLQLKLRNANNRNDYYAFVVELYEQLDSCFAVMARNCNLLHDKKETDITNRIEMFLEGAKIPCRVEANSNGHTDLNISYGKFVWLGEAKLHKGEKWTYHGFRQLTENYSTGLGLENRGGIIVYNTTKGKSSEDCAKEWQDYIVEKVPDIQCDDYCDMGYFDMVMPKHPKTKNPYYLRNYFVNLQYTKSKEFKKDLPDNLDTADNEEDD